MKTISLVSLLIFVSGLLAGPATAQTIGDVVGGVTGAVADIQNQTGIYVNFIRQEQMESGIVRDVDVAIQGQMASDLAIDGTGARFELWTVKSVPLTNIPLISFLLDSKYVGAYTPKANLTLRSEDPYTGTPRTRADRPFYLDVAISGLLTGEDDPPASKGVIFYRHVQSYGEDGNATTIDRSDAEMIANATVNAEINGTATFTVSSIPGTDQAKLRGEERFSIYTIEDYEAPSTQLVSEFIQIWPVADARLFGIVPGQKIKLAAPTLSIALNDLYPDSETYAHVYPGDPQLGTEGTVIPGSGLVINDYVPHDRVLTITDYDDVFTADGRWTLEVITTTPFGTERLAYVSFDIDRKIRINGQVTTIE